MDATVGVVQEWHEALNTGDIERLAALSHEDIEVAGPRGIGRGSRLLRDWAARAGIRLDPGRVFRRGQVVVVGQRATWNDPETGLTGEPQEVASEFLVEEGRVRRVERHADLGAALAAAGLGEADEVRPGKG